ncbi:hypothetical protein [Streptomyces sp. P3]|nr:hypothetical protein [Streptomyces sp. P3]
MNGCGQPLSADQLVLPAWKSWTAKLGNEAGGKLRAREAVYGDYGIM